MRLMSTFDDLRSSFSICYYFGDLSSWRPETEEEKLAFAELIASENRPALRAWYSKYSAINAGAEAMRQVLRKAINEELPLAKE
jgi:hypothetical protein